MSRIPLELLGYNFSDNINVRREHHLINKNYRRILDEDEKYGVSYDVAEHMDWTIRDFGSVVTIDKPFRMRFSKIPQYRHTNQRNDHRFHRDEQNAALVSNRPPCDVNEYIRRCEAVGAVDGKRYASMGDAKSRSSLSRNGVFNQTRQTAWIARWRHTGGTVKGSQTKQPADTLYPRCWEEREYQKKLWRYNNYVVIGEFYIHNGNIYYKHADTDDRTLPRPITDWYMFSRRDYWVEDASFEHRHRFPGGGRSGLLVPWHELGVWAIPYLLLQTQS